MALINTDKIITDDDLIDFLLDRHKETGNYMFLMAANSVALYRKEVNFLNFCVNRFNGWISVEDRLPEPFVSVLAFRNGKISIDYHEENGWFAYDFEEKRATHWMPLPAPPTEKEN